MFLCLITYLVTGHVHFAIKHANLWMTAQNMTTEGPERLSQKCTSQWRNSSSQFSESNKQPVLPAGSENSNAAGWAEQWGSAQQPPGGRWGREGHLHFWRGLQTHQGGHRSDSYTGRAVERACCTCCVYVWAKVLHLFIYIFFHVFICRR